MNVPTLILEESLKSGNGAGKNQVMTNYKNIQIKI